MIIIASIIIGTLNSFYLSGKVIDNINHSTSLASVSKTVILLLNSIVINVIFSKYY